ncbi:Hypothetical protein, putative [Bodo saltans]|uniref:Uncharacterized protein n=1 Tax=Bodo saltans TaxID=75058 RepID=A0A0S4IIR9_BODSA|nr:Hypothetical protein, putative [Bodo saltans]|eukprot:CUE72987.1 Hypothetical protein, putative [Bodo saltans]
MPSMQWRTASAHSNRCRCGNVRTPPHITIGGSQQAKTKKSLDVEIRGAPNAIPVLTSKQTALHISLRAPVPPSSSLLHTPAADSIGVASSSSSPLPPLVVISGIRINESVLVSGGAITRGISAARQHHRDFIIISKSVETR